LSSVIEIIKATKPEYEEISKNEIRRGTRGLLLIQAIEFGINLIKLEYRRRILLHRRRWISV
jgi:hypothetical protein